MLQNRVEPRLGTRKREGVYVEQDEDNHGLLEHARQRVREHGGLATSIFIAYAG
jgi:hypothetical protein